jgi:hypothetical protein
MDKPELVAVRITPVNPIQDLYGILCEYDDGIGFKEVWGSREDTEAAVALRRMDIH